MSTSSHYNYQVIPPSTSHLPQGSEVDSAKKARQRFMGGLAIAFITYLALASFLSVRHESRVEASDVDRLYQVAGLNFFEQIPDIEPGIKHEGLPSIPNSPPDDLPGPSKDDGEIIECTTRESWSPEPSLTANRVPWKIREEHVAHTTFSMPLDAPNHYFLSRGAHAAGTFTLENDDSLDGDKFYIRIQASWRHEIAMQSSQLCLLKRQSGSIGLGIYTRGRERRLDRRLDINFVLRVQFPTKNAPLQLNSLSAGLSQFEMDIKTKEKVDYGDLVFATSNSAIRSTGAVAKDLVFVTSNGPILGTYNVTKSMVITTSNGRVDINVNAFNNDATHPTSVTATTSNGRVDVKAGLYYTGEPVLDLPSSIYDLPKKSNGTFAFDFISSNGGVAVDFKEAPIRNALSLSTTTSNAGVHLDLHPTYEGKVNAIFGSNGGIKIDAKEPKTQDPTGRGRERIVEIKRVWTGIVTGTIAWGMNSQMRGELVTKSSNGVCTLRL